MTGEIGDSGLPGKKTCRFVAFAILVAASLGGEIKAQTIIAESRFDAGTEGWTVMRTESLVPLTPMPVPNGYLTWIDTGGNSGGYFQHVDPNDSRTSYWQAPPAFLGDKSSAYGGVLSFDLKQSATSSQYDIADVVMQGAGITLALDSTYNPRTLWTRYHVLLASGGGWHVGTLSGPVATQAEISQVLGSLTALYIRAEYRSGDDTDGIDNVILTEPYTDCPSSMFDEDNEGWWTRYDTAIPTWSASTGYPGGCMTATDLADNQTWRYLAPAKFLGNRSALYGGLLEFDLKATPIAQPDPNEGLNMVIVIGSEIVLTFAADFNPSSSGWTHFAVPISPMPQWTRQIDGLPATEQDFADVFGSLSRLTIRGEFYSGVDIGSLDNVVFLECRPCLVAGDFDQSGHADSPDVPTMVDVMLGLDIDPWHLLCADSNMDGYANGADLNGFVQVLLTP